MSTPASHRHLPPPHLTVVELANRWRCTRETVSRNYRKWGFCPIDVAGALLFPLEQIEAVERSRMVNLPTTEAEAIAAKRRRGRPRKTEATAVA